MVSEVLMTMINSGTAATRIVIFPNIKLVVATAQMLATAPTAMVRPAMDKLR
jgi:hypothetical protein